jgi:hypothetical protein
MAETPEIVRRTTCRVCASTDLEPILSLGSMPLANAFLRSPLEFASERSYPLELYFCSACALMQLLDVVRADIMFRHYLYITGVSATQVTHTSSYARVLTERLGLGPKDLVVEIASNDGSLLRAFAAAGVQTLGVEPARNLAAEAAANGIETVAEFFTHALARRMRAERGKARVVVANNVLAHVDDVRDFLAGCSELIDDEGIISIEVPYVGDLIERIEYDTIYHEHLSYFSFASLLRAAESAGLAALRIDRLPVHGGSLRLTLGRTVSGHAPEVRAVEAEEQRAGFTGIERYRRFAREVLDSRTAFVSLLERLNAEGSRIAGYAAPAKGNTLMNFCRIDDRLIRYTVDKSPRKVGLYTPGAHLQVRPVSALYAPETRPDYIVVLAWNIGEEIMKQERAFRDTGGRFIIPIPRPQVV